MNQRQKILLWCGVAVLVAIWLFPPWNVFVEAYDPTFGHTLNLPAYAWKDTYQFVFGSSELAGAGREVRVDWDKLITSSVPVVLLTAAAMLTVRTRRHEQEA